MGGFCISRKKPPVNTNEGLWVIGRSAAGQRQHGAFLVLQVVDSDLPAFAVEMKLLTPFHFSMTLRLSWDDFAMRCSTLMAIILQIEARMDQRPESPLTKRRSD
jgi:hypothetical protein